MAYNKKEKMRGMTERLGTFKAWTFSDKPEARRMARAGLFFTGPGDRTECGFCSVVIEGWHKSDDPVERHASLAPGCEMVKHCLKEQDDERHMSSIASVTSAASGASAASAASSVDLGGAASSSGRDADAMSASNDSGVGSDAASSAASAPNRMPTNLNQAESTRSSVESVVDVRTRKPKRSSPPECYKKLQVRVDTFMNVAWPPGIAAQPDNLAKAGFFYVGPNDRVKCGFCGGVLKHWKKDDSAIEEHVRHFPDCSFVKTIEQQTEILSRKIRSRKHVDGLMTSEQLMAEKGTRHKTKEDDLNTRTLLTMGYSHELVRKAKRRVHRLNLSQDLPTLVAQVQELEEILMGLKPRDEEDEEDEAIYSADEEKDEEALLRARNLEEKLEAYRVKDMKQRKELEELRDQVTCKICVTNPLDTLFLTCRHFVTCKECAEKVKDCPVCRSTILGTVDVFRV